MSGLEIGKHVSVFNLVQLGKGHVCMRGEGIHVVGLEIGKTHVRAKSSLLKCPKIIHERYHMKYRIEAPLNID